MALFAVGIATFLAFARLPEKAQGTIWAEDGGMFLRDALEVGWTGVLSPYEGYLHFVPRVAANFVVTFVPVDYYALAMNLLSCFVVAVVAVLVFHLSQAFTGSSVIRLCWAAIAVLVAPGPLETLGNFANVHWYFLWLTPWLLLKPAKSRGEGVLLFFVALAISLTEIISLLFVPLMLHRLRDKAHWPARLGLTIGLVCQIVCTLNFPRSPSSGYQVNLLSVFQGWFLNSSSALFYGNSTSIIHNIETFGALPIIVAAVPFAFLFILAMWKGAPADRLLAGVMVTASFATWAAAQVVNPQPFFDYASFSEGEWGTFFLSRYSTVPSMFLIALAPLAAAVAMRSWASISAAIIGGFLTLQLVFFFPSGVARADGPVWKDGILGARAACDADPGLDSAPVPIAPRGWVADKVYIACFELRDKK